MSDTLQGSELCRSPVLDPRRLSSERRDNGTPRRRPGLSLVVITANEERNLQRCLRSASWADEIVVVDSFSTDRTLEIARDFTSNVVQRPWPGYSAQKAFAVSLSDCEWVLSLDADEEVTPELAQAISKIVKSERRPADEHGQTMRGLSQAQSELESGSSVTSPDGYFIRRQTFFMGRPLYHAARPDWQLRLFRAERAEMLHRRVHEAFSTTHPADLLGGVLNHYTAETIQERFDTVNRFSGLEAEERRRVPRAWAKLRAWTYALAWPPRSFIGNYFLRLGMLDGLPGFVWCAATAIEHFLVGVKQLERIGAEGSAAGRAANCRRPAGRPLHVPETGGEPLCG